MVYDKEIGHYKDLSYEALSDEGLSWEERTRLFGGETAHYGSIPPEANRARCPCRLRALPSRNTSCVLLRCGAIGKGTCDARGFRACLQSRDQGQGETV